MASKVNGVTARQAIGMEGRDGDALGLQFGERAFEALNARGIGEDDEVKIPAELRRAVEHARLAAHE